MVDVKKSIVDLQLMDKNSLQKIENVIYYLINDGVWDLMHKSDKSEQFDIGIGLVTLTIENDEVFYHFTPSIEFQKAVQDGIENKNTFKEIVTNQLKNKVIELYKELL